MITTMAEESQPLLGGNTNAPPTQNYGGSGAPPGQGNVHNTIKSTADGLMGREKLGKGRSAVMADGGWPVPILRVLDRGVGVLQEVKDICRVTMCIRCDRNWQEIDR